MITRAVRGGRSRRGWVAGDEFGRRRPRVAAHPPRAAWDTSGTIAANRRVPVHAGLHPRRGPRPADTAAGVADPLRRPRQQGQRWYSWAWIDLRPEDPDETGHHWLLIRRNDTTGELAYHPLLWPPPRDPCRLLVAVAGQRWRIEESFRAAKTLVGLDQHQVRTWISWLRWTSRPCSRTLPHRDHRVRTCSETRAAGLSALASTSSVASLSGSSLTTTTTPAKLLAWSRWRRQHQARARTSHYSDENTNDHELRL